MNALMKMPQDTGSACCTDNVIEALWADYERVLVSEADLRDRVRNAEQAMPWWARPGLSQVDSQGAFIGPWVGWPAIESYTAPEEGRLKLIRPGPRDVELYRGPFPEELYLAMRHALNRRREEQRWHRKGVGLDKLDKDLKANARAVIRIERQIQSRALEHPSLAAACATTLLSIRNATVTFEAVNSIATPLLAVARPSLSGPLHAAVGEILDELDAVRTSVAVAA